MFLNKALLIAFGLLLVCSVSSAEGNETEVNPSVIENGLPGPFKNTNLASNVIHAVRVVILGVYGNINGFIDNSINFVIRIPQRVFFLLMFVPRIILKAVSAIPIFGSPAGRVVANLDACQKQDLAKNFGRILLDEKNCLVGPVTSIVRDTVTILQKLEEIALAFAYNPDQYRIFTLMNAILTSIKTSIPLAQAVIGLLPHLVASVMHLPACITPGKAILLVKEAIHYVGQYFRCIV